MSISYFKDNSLYEYIENSLKLEEWKMSVINSLSKDRLICCICTGLLMIVLTGCSGGSSSTADVLPVEPGAAATMSLKGIDTDNNGVRDEVDIAISQITPDTDERSKLTSIAMEYQEILSSENPDISSIVNKIGCIEVTRSPDSRNKLSATEMFYLVFDTPERRAAFNALDGNRGTVTGSADDLTCN